jgi:type III restriction enzyme
VQKEVEYDFVYVDEDGFNKYKPSSFQELVRGFTEYKEKL